MEQELPWPREVALFYRCLQSLGWACWLDSGDVPGPGARWHILTAQPYRRLVVRAGRCAVAGGGGPWRPCPRAPLEQLRHWLGKRRRPSGRLPFSGGALGYLGYEFGRRLHGLPVTQTELPEAVVGLYDWAVVLDLRHRRAWLVGEGVPEGLADALAEAAQRQDWPEAPWQGGPVRRLASREVYAHAFRRIQHYLRRGDCYQVNYAQPFEAPFRGSALTLYRQMRSINPAPYGALLSYPFGEVLSASPEQFLRLDGDRVVTRPIKGTRPRAADPAEDRRLAGALARSEKDRAENVMIVDLLRNDLGRVCLPGSIQVPRLFEVVSFPTVHHLVSTVCGRLAPGRDALDLLAACLPGGSITGAPKRRAMEIIQELEGRPRGVYCGTLFYLGYDGRLDSNIAIRTLQRSGDRLRYWAGGGIVADSRQQQEYDETLDKAAAFLQLFSSTGGCA